MKTLVVLSALASIAIAAPALPGDSVADFKLPENKFPEAKREKKSPLPDVDTAVNNPTSQNSDFDATGRSFGLKKPIIIKKKAGYHIYRNSDEELQQADSQESCRKQVKVKLCDEEKKTKAEGMRSSSIEDPNVHMTGHDMKHSIQLAKEAVENLQRDLQKIEQKPSIKLAPWQQKDAESDAEIHEDIEVARKALEHVHKNFGNLEPMSLHATTAKDAENLDDVPFTIAKTEEERMAQWKEAIENIHKNVEIARNIEDTFKSVSDQASLKNDETAAENFHETTQKSQMRTMKNSNSKEAECDEEQMLKTKSKPNHEIKKIQKNVDKKEMVGDDMKTSASTISEVKVQGPLNEQALIGKAITKNTSELSNEPPSNALKENKSDNQNDKSAEESSLSTKAIEDESKTKPKAEEAKSQNNMKSAELDQINPENTAKELNKLQDKIQQKSAEHGELSQAKENKKVEPQQNTQQAKAAEETKMLLRSEEHTARESEEKAPLTTTQEKWAPSMKSSEQLEKSSTQNKAVENDKQLLAKSADSIQSHTSESVDLKPEPSTNTEMKLAENDMNSKQWTGTSDMRWAQNKNMHIDQSGRMKTAGESKHDFHSTDQLKNTQFVEQPHHIAMKNSENVDASNTHGFLPHSPSFHDNPHMSHGKSAHMDSLAHSNFHMNMRDAASEFVPENHMFRWKQPHETGRTPYGSGPANGMNIGGSGAGAGAVGVFPNANIGSCGIPLLLSCAPSVVSGSLAKAHPTGYGAPAYRTEDDFNFHTKRDVKKTNEIPATKIQRTILDIKH